MGLGSVIYGSVYSMVRLLAITHGIFAKCLLPIFTRFREFFLDPLHLTNAYAKAHCY